MNTLDVYSIKFTGCRNIYPLRIIKPCEKFKYDEQEQLFKVLSELSANDVVINCAIFDNLKRAIIRLAKNHAAKFACEYCENFATPFIDMNKKSLNLIRKKYEKEEKKLSQEIQQLEEQEEEEDEEEEIDHEYLTQLRETLTTLSQEKESELKKKSRKQLVWPASTRTGNLRTIEGINQICNDIEANPDILKTDPDHCKGIKGRSHMLNHPSFHMINDMPCEYMHLMCLGVVRRMLELNFKVGENRDRVTKRKLSSPEMFNELIKLIQVPYEFSRRCRNLDLSVMKASELRNILIFFFPIVLDCIDDEFMEEKILWLHLVYVVRACILPNIEFQQIDVETIESGCEKFYNLYEKLYGKQNCSYSIHVAISHLLLIRGNEPLTFKSAFKFESFFSELRNLFHPGTVSPVKQILQNCYMKRILEYHSCEKKIHYTSDKTGKKLHPGKENNHLIYTYNEERELTIYSISEIINDDKFHCKMQGKFRAQMHLASEYDWSKVGVFKVGPISEESYVVKRNEICGKVLKVNRFLITCPNNVLIEQ